MGEGISDMSDYRISVIIPVYNSADTIIDALDSVRDQTRFDLISQILVIDDGSKDNSAELIRRYIEDNPGMPIEFYQKENGGVSSARNMALAKASGNWIAFLDSDDVWLENRISRQVEAIDANPDIDFLGAGIDDKGLNILGRRITSLYKANIRDLTLKFFPVTPSILMRRRIYDEMGGYNEGWRYAEDGEYYMRICLKYNYYFLPEHLIDIGHGKRAFGEKGLSSNLKAMYEGNKKLIMWLHDDKVISTPFYLFLRVFYWLKHIRRIIITKLG